MAKILAFDISSVNTGFAIFENGIDGYGAIKIPKKKTEVEKLIFFKKAITKLIKVHKPDIILVEDIWLKNVKTYKTLARYQGILMVVAYPLNTILLTTVFVRKTLECGRSKEEAFAWFKKYSGWDLDFNSNNDEVDAILLCMAYNIDPAPTHKVKRKMAKNKNT
jgi:Holliday junction resolvasome RuvABC endonuclease subunit